MDIGGTTTDVGVLRKRFPREASTAVRVGGRADQLPHARRAQRGAGRRVVRAQDRRGQNDSGTAQRRLQPNGGERGRGGGGEGGVGVVGWRKRGGEGGGGGGGGNHVLMFKDNVGKISERLVGAHIGFSERTETN